MIEFTVIIYVLVDYMKWLKSYIKKKYIFILKGETMIGQTSRVLTILMGFHLFTYINEILYLFKKFNRVMVLIKEVTKFKMLITF